MDGIDYKEILSFYKNKKVLVTGNTGFKGSWLTFILLSAGAKVTGYSLEAPAAPGLLNLAGIGTSPGLCRVTGDVRNAKPLLETVQNFRPEIVFHLAAQPIVRDSYKDPVGTYATNVMGTVNLCEAVRRTDSVRSFLNVTTDKVYRNNGWAWGYRETDVLDGFDPYSNSKSCSELVTRSYRDSFFTDGRVRVSTVRAGNVIGGGDFSNDRIIPDCVRAVTASDGVIRVRNPYAVRPYEHVLEALFAYLMIAKAQYENPEYAGSYNVGPDDADCVTTGKLVDLFCKHWNKDTPAVPASWENTAEENAPHEANFLKLDCSKIKSVFGWKPRWHIDRAVEETVRFTKIRLSGGDVRTEMEREIGEYTLSSAYVHP